MAKSELTVRIDASEIIKWIMIGQEQMFIALTDFTELEEIANINGIDLEEGLE